jgi:hypothetical protein
VIIIPDNYLITPIIRNGNWGSGNFSSVDKPVIKEIVSEEEDKALERLLRFKRIIIVLISTTSDFEKGISRGKEATQSADFHTIWIKEASRSLTKAIYDKVRDIILVDNDQTVYSWLEVNPFEYNTEKKGVMLGTMEITGHKTSKGRV